ncbi:nitrogen permease regulator of amino acid transport activity 3-domain-containing protein [Gautieria morchelliformis]|nr:nitrogen permease regulator of amino acid transport activity 3-domain-containing protein [Gautieria morchelliformis]
MAHTLLAILFATSSASGETIAFRWPASPRAFPRLARPRPPSELDFEHVDASYRAATYSELPADGFQRLPFSPLEEDKLEYEWQRPAVKRYRSQSFTSSGRSSSGGRHSPVNQRSDHGALHVSGDMNEYEIVLGFNVDHLAHFLCPGIDNCHQKFELVVDDLAFIGHPVCVDERGNWSFTWETPSENAITEASSQTMLQLFHVVFVLDLPDPSSSASGNLNKYFDTIYQTVAFSLTAVLFNEQVLHKYVEHEWDLLVKLKEDCMSNGEFHVFNKTLRLFDPGTTGISHDNYVAQSLKDSSLARAFEHIYTSIRANALARLTLHNISLDLQLPPFLDSLLRADPSDPGGSSSLGWSGQGNYDDDDDERGDDDYADWGPELSFGWKLPALTPWKSLLLLDIDSGDCDKADPLQNLNRPGLTTEERDIAEGVSRFLDSASIFVPLSDMATLLDWDLHKQVFPTVRYLVQRRRAKVVDLVRSSLKSIFTLPARIETPISELTADFAQAFPTLPPLPLIFSRLSSSPDNFFETVVKSKENIPTYQTVIIWLLKRDLLVMLHMRFRLVATPTLKQLVAATRRERRKMRERQRMYQQRTIRGRRRKSSAENHNGSPSLSRSRSLLRSVALPEHNEEAVHDESGEDASLSPVSQSSVRVSRDMAQRPSFRSPPSNGDYDPRSPTVVLPGEHRQPRRRFSDTSSLMPRERVMRRWHGRRDEDGEGNGDDVESESESDPDDPDDLEASSLISTPERATPKERRWLRGMTMGKNPLIAKRFEVIHKYFDGKKTVDEILHKAEISRKQLREVLHHFRDHITPFLHP